MANDNVSLETVSVAGASIATDQKSGAEHYQKIKIAFGADDTFTDVVSTTTTPFPVALSDVDNAILVTIDGVLDTINAKLASGTVIGDVNLGSTDATALAAIQTAVEGTLTVGSHAVTNAGTFAVQISDTSFAVADGNALGEGVLVQGDDGTDRKNINVDATTGDVQVDVTNTVTVSGPLTDTELRATPVPVSLTGVATAANQLPDGHNVTVDNASIAVTHAALTELGTVITADDDDFVAGTTPGIAVQGVYQSSPNEITDGDLGTIGITNNREVKAVISSGTLTTVTELTQMNGNAITLNNGAADAGTQRVTLANDSTGQVALAAGTSLAGDVGLSGARTSGGTTLYKNIDVDESEDEIKGTGGQVYWIHAMNMSATTKFLKIYNATAATVVVGTTVPDLTFPLATQGDTNGAGFTLSIPNGIAFSTAITIAATTGVADADSGAPGENEVIVNLGYA